MSHLKKAVLVGLALAALGVPLALRSQESKPPAVTLAQFRALRWISGSWRGIDGAGKPFYEEYRAVDDSTIVMHAFSDAAFKVVTPDSSRIDWRGGVVSSRGSGVPSVATQITATSVTFVRPGTTRSFAFTRDGADQWTARIHAPGSAEIVYVMRRVTR